MESIFFLEFSFCSTNANIQALKFIFQIFLKCFKFLFFQEWFSLFLGNCDSLFPRDFKWKMCHLKILYFCFSTWERKEEKQKMLGNENFHNNHYQLITNNTFLSVLKLGIDEFSNLIWKFCGFFFANEKNKEKLLIIVYVCSQNWLEMARSIKLP